MHLSRSNNFLVGKILLELNKSDNSKYKLLYNIKVHSKSAMIKGPPVILNWGQYIAFLNPRLNTSPSEARLSILTEGSEKLILTPVKMMFTVISWNHHPKPP